MAETDDSYPPIDLADPGRMISASKSGYRSEYPDHLVAFNGGIYVRSKGHVWSGDLDVTRDTPRLREIARELGEDVFIFRERAYGSPVQWELGEGDTNAVAIIKADG